MYLTLLQLTRITDIPMDSIREQQLYSEVGKKLEGIHEGR